MQESIGIAQMVGFEMRKIVRQITKSSINKIVIVLSYGTEIKKCCLEAVMWYSGFR